MTHLSLLTTPHIPISGADGYLKAAALLAFDGLGFQKSGGRGKAVNDGRLWAWPRPEAVNVYEIEI